MEYRSEKLEVYQLAESFSDRIWKLAEGWNTFEKDTIGKQIVRSADSVSANIAESYGRYFYKESRQYFFYSRGSLRETKSWLSKCRRRNILLKDEADELITEAEKIPAKLNGYIKFIANSPKRNKGKEIE